MIISFGDKDTGKIWEGERIKILPPTIQEIARRKQRMLNNSQNIKITNQSALMISGKLYSFGKMAMLNKLK